MARKANVFPSYLLHKQSGQARVRIEGRDHLLGPFGSDESRVRYGELIARMAGGAPIDPIASTKRGRLPRNDSEADPGPTINEICLVFLRHAEKHYVKAGKQTSEVSILKFTMRPLTELYGMTPASEFGPLSLKAVRARMVELGWSRSTINTSIGRIRRIFKHAIENELIDSSILDRLKCVAPLLAGRTEAHDNAPRTSVGLRDIAVVRRLVSPLVRDLIGLQRLTGARSGELLMLTSGMIDQHGEVWTARLTEHKTKHHGQSRMLHFGPKAQRILRKYLTANPEHRMFKIIRTAYCRAITRACEKAGIPRWVPHQLRHTAADQVRQHFGLDHTQAVLGHSTADMSEHYARVSSSKAAEVARKIG
jgi:integrase